MKTRLESLDILRGISVILMIFINLFDETAVADLLYSSQGQFIDFWVTAFVPNIFVFIMGFFLIIANKFQPFSLFKKGLYILFLGYALNIVRYPLFMFLNDRFDSFAQAYNANSYYVHMVDIYIFVGFACLLLIPFALLPRLYPIFLLFSSWVMYMSDKVATLRSFLKILPDDFIEYAHHIVLPMGKNVYFPLFPWFSYILLGIGCGILYQKISRPSFYKLVTASGVLLSFVGYSVFFSEYSGSNFQMRADFYQHEYTVGILLLGLCLLSLTLAEIFNILLPSFIKNPLAFTGKNTISFYIISWLITMWGVFSWGWQGSFELSDALTTTLYIYITGMVATYTWYYSQKVKKK